MTPVEARSALDVGADVATQAAAGGARMLVTGDMGIGNTTASAAVIAALTGLPAAAVTGRGAGADDAILARKTEVVERALRRIPVQADPLLILTELGGLEIAALAGFIVGAAASRLPVVIDGVIAAAAALAAAALVPDAAPYLIGGHRSAEPGSAAALSHLGIEPLLDLQMRLGEGSGATLAVPLVQAAAKILARDGHLRRRRGRGQAAAGLSRRAAGHPRGRSPAGGSAARLTAGSLVRLLRPERPLLE